jgi:Holliday junction DNA helicase RuvB
MVSAKGWRHLGLTPPPRQAQPIDLFNADVGND